VTVFFGVQITQPADQQVNAYSSAPSVADSKLASFAIAVGT